MDMSGIVIASLGFVLAAICAGIMGLAIQRGATCTVIAVNEIMERGSARRLAAIVEAALWVTGGLLLAKALGLLTTMPAGYPLTGWSLLGGALLGLGAVINGACVFGALARLGSGEWAYLATPLGFFLGCLTLPHLVAMPSPAPLAEHSRVLLAPDWLGFAVLALAAWRILPPALAFRRHGGPLRQRAGRAWTPHAATAVIGVTFVVSLIAAGAWAYTEALADLARNMADSLDGRALLFAMLMAGAVLGGWAAGRLRHTRTSASGVLRCLAGGMVMAWGSLLVPGSNDGLLLLAMPLLWPYAWAAFATMCLTIAAARLLRRAVARG